MANDLERQGRWALAGMAAAAPETVRGLASAIATALLPICLLAAPAAAQTDDGRRSMTGRENAELRRLSRLVNRVVTNDLPGGDAWLKWSGHFLRGADGKTYVPFTLTIDEAPDRFGSISLYLRVIAAANVGATQNAWRRDSGTPLFNNPEADGRARNGNGIDVTASENAARAQSLMSVLTRPILKRSFEDGHFVEPVDVGDGTKVVRRALALRPGQYVIYAAVREYPLPPGRSTRSAGWAVMKRRVTVPDLGNGRLATSSVILADRIEPIDARLSETEQARRPYALGAAEITPRRDSIYTPADDLTLVFFAYDVASRHGAPDVSVRYRFFRSELSETLVVATAPQRIDASTLPAGFVLEPDDHLPIDATIPLESFDPGLYRLEVELMDHLAGETTTLDVRFTVRDGT